MGRSISQKSVFHFENDISAGGSAETSKLVTFANLADLWQRFSAWLSGRKEIDQQAPPIMT